MLPRPQLTPAETAFLQSWIWEESNFERPHTPRTKATQIEKVPHAASLLADIVAAAMSAEEQVAIANGSEPRANPPWPWITESD
jgi:hypothetical protein